MTTCLEVLSLPPSILLNKYEGSANLCILSTLQSQRTRVKGCFRDMKTNLEHPPKQDKLLGELVQNPYNLQSNSKLSRASMEIFFPKYL